MTRINYGLWSWRVISWDTLVPACLLFLPAVIESLFAKPDDLLVIAAAVLPILAFVLRTYAGNRQIAINQCSASIRGLQRVALVVGVTPLVLADCLIIMMHSLGPKPGKGPTPDRLFLFLGPITVFYLLAMIIAMYPGRTISAED